MRTYKMYGWDITEISSPPKAIGNYTMGLQGGVTWSRVTWSHGLTIENLSADAALAPFVSFEGEGTIYLARKGNKPGSQVVGYRDADGTYYGVMKGGYKMAQTALEIQGLIYFVGGLIASMILIGIPFVYLGICNLISANNFGCLMKISDKLGDDMPIYAGGSYPAANPLAA